MINVNLLTLKGQQIAADLLSMGWEIVTFDTLSITLQNPSYA
jgi:hypothetical protein